MTKYLSINDLVIRSDLEFPSTFYHSQIIFTVSIIMVHTKSGVVLICYENTLNAKLKNRFLICKLSVLNRGTGPIIRLRFF